MWAQVIEMLVLVQFLKFFIFSISMLQILVYHCPADLEKDSIDR